MTIEKPTILFEAPNSDINGANLSMLNLIDQLRNYYHFIVVLPVEGDMQKRLLDDGITFYDVPGIEWVSNIHPHWYGIRSKLIMIQHSKIISRHNNRIIQIIKDEHVSIVHINSSSINTGYKAALKQHIPIVWHLREFNTLDHGMNFLNHIKSRNEFRHVQRLIPVSRAVEIYFKNFFRVKGNYDLVYNGIDPKTVFPEPIFDKKNIVVTIAGGINPQKGQKIAIDAINKLIEQGIKNIKLRIVGAGPIDYETFLKEYVEKLHISSNVVFIGLKTTNLEIWKETDIAIVASEAEAFGRVTVEALMHGSVVIGSNSGGTPEILSKTELGVLFKNQDSDDLARKILSVIRNRNRYRLISKEESRKISTLFSIESTATKLKKIYDNILSSE
ncbi:glycosyltransferase family 4 protein [Oenococcus oeni]|uniref:Glycosyltransferase, group 1 family protein n=2 Tax=Oenococcus oeni TaxID=1247 RepID=A0AAQ2ZGN0_OENOE|nr:glycosyltransferase family 4 protein [Oenococcus oeni]OIM07963.1 hypothetical protein ATX52_08640 [Oenococcus oeni]OIM23617.1 hypothetical protein ATX62_08405 [Oenococcus oeni]SYW07919.1 putative Glycosyltransferase, group 1 family protein [Oenococcus oeni]VDB99154.1 putative Glycosyltransferase, group 1 family protein [Oenococcus oeni]